MKKQSTSAGLGPRWVVAGLLAGLVAAVTIFLRVPIPKSGGYLNLGDIIIVFAGLYLGPGPGLLVGGVGSAIADAIGYPIFIIPTLLIKGAEGFLSGVFPARAGHLRIIGAVLGVTTMVFGYYITEAHVFGSIGPAAAKTELPFNLVQAAVGVIGGYAMYRMISRWSGEEEQGDQRQQ